MKRLDLLMIVPRSDLLRRLNCFLRFECEFVETEHVLSPPFSREHGAGCRPAPRRLSNPVFPPSVYFPLPEEFTLTFTWRGLDSSRFGKFTVRTPFLYSARIASAFTVFGKEKLRL